MVPVAGLPEVVVRNRVLSSTETVLSLLFAVIRSGMPSPLMSATAMVVGSLPVVKVCCVAKLGVVAPGVVVLSSTETVSPLLLETIRSGIPSLFTSTAATP